uniref:Uncharacterized protein n=1 Tax=Arundo donax TaxID=35708 RepID=A0A0A8XNG3_ARUDO
MDFMLHLDHQSCLDGLRAVEIPVVRVGRVSHVPAQVLPQ